MSIYVRGIEMPINAEGCEVIIRIQPNGEVLNLHGFHLDAHAVPVPDHGRLIDADAYRAEMKKRQDACAEWRDDIKDGGGYGTELYYRMVGRKGVNHASKEARMTNGDFIRSMTDEELAEWIFELLWSYDAICDKNTERWLKWLKQEVNNNSTT